MKTEKPEIKIGEYSVVIFARRTRYTEYGTYPIDDTHSFLNDLSIAMGEAKNNYTRNKLYGLARYISDMGMDIYKYLEDEGVYKEE